MRWWIFCQLRFNFTLFAGYVRPICLPPYEFSTNEYTGKLPIVAGWGKSVQNQRKFLFRSYLSLIFKNFQQIPIQKRLLTLYSCWYLGLAAKYKLILKFVCSKLCKKDITWIDIDKNTYEKKCTRA